MSKDRLHLFPDTNLFFQCGDLNDLPWSTLSEFQEIELIVARPIQKEIDRHKGGGNGRLARRARRIASDLREVASSGLRPVVIRQGAPRVTLSLRIDLKPDPGAAEQLDYSEADDALVGVALAFSREDQARQVAVLTHDGGVMASAVTAGVRHIPIPNDWLLPPEDTKADKELRAVQAELTRLRRSEPEFEIACVDSQRGRVHELTFEWPVFRPLGERQAATLMERARGRFPMRTDFAAKAPKRPPGSLGVSLDQLAGFSLPPDSAQVEKYQQAYRKWEEELKAALGSLHLRLARDRLPARVKFVARNIGTRPATEVLVEMQVHGPFLIRRPPRRGGGKGAEEVAPLPAPPAPPRFRSSIMDMPARHRMPWDPLSPRLGRDLAPPFHAEKHDPEGFYYKGHPSAGTQLRLTCDLWRHGLNEEAFEANIELENEVDMQGAVEFRVHAGNLSDTRALIVPVSVRTLAGSTFEEATRLVEELTAPDSK